LLPGELDMNALSLTDELASELLSGKLTLSEADKRFIIWSKSLNPQTCFLTYKMRITPATHTVAVV